MKAFYILKLDRVAGSLILVPIGVVTVEDETEVAQKVVRHYGGKILTDKVIDLGDTRDINILILDEAKTFIQ